MSQRAAIRRRKEARLVNGRKPDKAVWKQTMLAKMRAKKK